MWLVDGKGDDLLLGANPGPVSDRQQLPDFIQCQAKDGFAGNFVELKERGGEMEDGEHHSSGIDNNST